MVSHLAVSCRRGVARILEGHPRVDTPRHHSHGGLGRPRPRARVSWFDPGPVSVGRRMVSLRP